MKTLYTLSALIALSAATAAQASPILYRPMNPHISPGAFPSMEQSVTNTANTTKPKSASAVRSSATSESELVKRSIISNLSSRFTAELTAACAVSDPNCFGSQFFQDGSRIDYTTSGNIRTITFVSVDGSTFSVDITL